MRTDAETDAFTNLIQALAAQFRVECDVAMLLGYSMALDDLPIAAIQEAVAAACRESQFMPTGAELRKLAGVESPTSRALIAWNAVKGTVATVGSYCSVDFDDPITNAVVRTLGGWVAFCGTPVGDESEKWKRKEFERIYCELWYSGVRPEMAKPLLGISDAENSASGFPIQPAARIAIGLSPCPERLKLGSVKTKAIGKFAGAIEFAQLEET